MIREATSERVIGRAKTVLVFEGKRPLAILTAINARVLEPSSEWSLHFSGPCQYEAATANHFREVVLVLVGRILTALGQSPCSFEISLTNPGAASALDLPAHVSGYSADLPVFVALLSAALKMPVRQDIISTGHIASLTGDVSQVRSLPAKVEAVLEEPISYTFLHPDLRSDRSQRILSPEEWEQAFGAVAVAAQRIRTVPVQNVDDVVREAFEERELVLSSLNLGYYSPGSHETCPVAIISEDIESRFWSVLSASFMQGDDQACKQLLEAFVLHHTRNADYPTGLGARLQQVLLSVPPTTRRLKIRFPLISTVTYARLAQYAQEDRDAQVLYDAIHGTRMPAQTCKSTETKENSQEDPAALEELDILLSEISDDQFVKVIGARINEARATFPLTSNGAASHDEFYAVINAFYIHLLRHCRNVREPVTAEEVEGEAKALIEETYARKGGRSAAFAEARYGINGGMRRVLDELTQQFLHKAREQQFLVTFTKALDPLEPEAQDRVIGQINSRLGNNPAGGNGGGQKSLDKSQVAELARLFAQGIDRVRERLRCY